MRRANEKMTEKRKDHQELQLKIDQYADMLFKLSFLKLQNVQDAEDALILVKDPVVENAIQHVKDHAILVVVTDVPDLVHLVVEEIAKLVVDLIVVLDAKDPVKEIVDNHVIPDVQVNVEILALQHVLLLVQDLVLDNVTEQQVSNI